MPLAYMANVHEVNEEDIVVGGKKKASKRRKLYAYKSNR